MNLILEILRSAPIDTTWLTLIVIGTAVLLSSVLRALLTFLLGGIAPAWIGRVAVPLQLAILGGAVFLVVDVIAPGMVVVWPALLVLTLAAAAIIPGNLVSEGVAYARIRLLMYYRVGDWVTLAGDQTGRVTSIDPFGTLVRTKTRDRVRIGNSRVLSMPIALHRAQKMSQAQDKDGWKSLDVSTVARGQGPLPRLSKRPSLGSTSTQALKRRRGA